MYIVRSIMGTYTIRRFDVPIVEHWVVHFPFAERDIEKTEPPETEPPKTDPHSLVYPAYIYDP